MSGIFYANPALAGASIDASFTTGGGAKLIDTSVRTYQTFTPTFSILDKVEAEIVNQGGNYKLNCNIKKFISGSWNTLASCGTEVVIAADTNWHLFDIENLEVTIGQEYAIFLSAASGGSGSYHLWKYSESNGTYAGGAATWHDTHYANGDFNFRTWGTDPVEMVDEQTNPGSDQDPEQTGVVPTTSSTATGEAPAATVSTSIVKPTGLTATYSDGVALTWKASTTADVDGYIVFRSETKGKGYTKLTNVAKAKLDYTDKTAAASKTYYYVVRATKGVEQSASSNEATITIPATAAPTIPLNLKVKGTGSNYIGVEWDKNPETNLSGYELTISKGTEKIETAQADVSATSYVFKNLEPVTEYTISLVAKNSDGKQSEPATLTASTIAELGTITPAGFQMDTLSWIMLGAAVILMGVLALMIVKRRKGKKLLRT